MKIVYEWWNSTLDEKKMAHELVLVKFISLLI